METMESFVTSDAAAKQVGVSGRRLRQLLKQGRVKNARKVGKQWIIPGICGTAAANWQRTLPQLWLVRQPHRCAFDGKYGSGSWNDQRRKSVMTNED